jgi:small conductance mechanosensitive channel
VQIAKLKLKAGIFLSVSVLTAGVVRADETVQAVANTSQAVASNFITLCKQAFSGGPNSEEALRVLVRDYFASAFLALTVAWISYIIASAIGRYIGGLVSRKVDLTLGKFLTKAVRNLLMIVVAMGVLSYFDVDVTGLAAVLAAVSFAVGMALQGTLGNFASGVMLLLFRPFKVNDYIVLSETEGTVEEIDLFTTRINTMDNRHVIVPNGEIFGSKLENYTRNELRRVDVNVGTAYSADIDQTRQALERAVMSIADGVTSPPPQVYLKELGASSVDWQVRVWCEPVHYWGVREQLTAAAKQQLDLAKIGIPFPQMDIHVVHPNASEQSITRAA